MWNDISGLQKPMEQFNYKAQLSDNKGTDLSIQ